MGIELVNTSLLVGSLIIFLVAAIQFVSVIKTSVIKLNSYNMLYCAGIIAAAFVVCAVVSAVSGPSLSEVTIHYAVLLFLSVLTVCTVQLIRQLIKAVKNNIQISSSDSILDPITGLYNRHYLQGRAEAEVARSKRYSAPLSVVALNISNFHAFNTEYGFQAGDRLLSQVADIIKSTLRETDVVARYEADCFVMLLTDTPEYCTERVVNRLNSKLEPLFLRSHMLNNVDTKGVVKANVKYSEAWCELTTRTGAHLIDSALDQFQRKKRLLNKQDTCTLVPSTEVKDELYEAA